MDFELPEESRIIRDTIRRFMEEEVRPHVVEWERNRIFPEDVVRALGQMGFLGMTVPETYGGSGITSVDQAIVIEEIARISPSIAVTVSVNSGIIGDMLTRFGNEEQKRRYLPIVATGQGLGGLAHTEPEAGSDAGAIRSRAVREGNNYILNGNKVWVTNAEKAAILVVQAVTNPAEGKRGLSSFIVETEWPGVHIGRREDKLGLHSSVTNPVTFENVRVPASNRLGEEGMGLRIVLSALDSGRIGVAAQAVGIAQGAYEYAREYATMRKTFGQPLVEHQAILFKLSDMATEIEAARWLTYRAAWLKDQGRSFTKAASMAKLYAAEMCQKVTYEAIQIYGSYGYSRDYPVERYFRDARVTTIYEGTSEIQRLVIARQILFRQPGA